MCAACAQTIGRSALQDLGPGQREDYTRAVSSLEGLTALAAALSRTSPAMLAEVISLLSVLRRPRVCALVLLIRRALAAALSRTSRTSPAMLAEVTILTQTPQVAWGACLGCRTLSAGHFLHWRAPCSCVPA